VLYSFKREWRRLVSLCGAAPGWFGHALGTTQFGGPNGDGAVFRLVKSGGGWKEQILYSFTGGADGGEPLGTLIMDKNGALYGTTPEGGCPGHSGGGTVFKLTPSVIGPAWSETVLHCFTGDNGDGCYPEGGAALDRQRVLYGTTMAGGTANLGTVWEIVP
jgi:hypothetical protein